MERQLVDHQIEINQAGALRILMDHFEIIYQDEHCVAVNKPSDVLVHRSYVDNRDRENLVRGLKRQLGQRVFNAHRLDRATSGVMILGLSSETARNLTQQFENRTVEKNYLAIVRGYTDDSGKIDIPLLEKFDRKAPLPQSEEEKPPQEALTEYVTLATSELPISAGKYPTSRFSLVRLKPHTGRRHQLRRHLKHISHPIVGDIKHGDHRVNQLIESEFGIRRLLLVAHELHIDHPVSGERMIFKASFGAGFDMALECLKLKSGE